jgi:hypothetical protein
MTSGFLSATLGLISRAEHSLQSELMRGDFGDKPCHDDDQLKDWVFLEGTRTNCSPALYMTLKFPILLFSIPSSQQAVAEGSDSTSTQ